MSGQTNQSVRLLIAEDHPSLGRSMAEGLREEGYEVDLVADGLEAERLLGLHKYACVMLDLILPGKDGMAILARNAAERKSDAGDVRDGADGLEDRVQGLDLGADDYIIKPFAWDELLAGCVR